MKHLRTRRVTPSHTPTLDHTVRALGELKLGETFEVEGEALQNIGPIVRGRCTWTALDRIMGGSVDFVFLVMAGEPHPRTGSITFTRISYPGVQGDLRTWIAPDQRARYTQRPDGLWERSRVTNASAEFPAPLSV